MNLKIRIFSILLALITCLSFVSCNKEPDGSDGDTPDENYSGPMTEGDGDGDGDETTEEDAGNPDETTVITSASELKNIKRKGNYILGANIDLGGESWAPIGTYGAPFEGTFDGSGYKITGLKVDSAKDDKGESLSYTYLYYGFFGVTKGATIKNAAFENAIVTASSNEVFTTVYSGIIAGVSIDTTISDCKTSGSINASSSGLNSISVAGGLIGAADNSSLKSCSSSTSVKTENSTTRAISGGLLGYSRLGTRLEKCFSTASVVAMSTIGVAYAGGIAGYCYKTEMLLCYSDSTVHSEVTSSSPESGAVGAAHSGGITAIIAALSDNNTASFTKCYSTSAKITAYSDENAVYVAGFASEVDYAKIKNCYSYATLEAGSLNASAGGAGLFGSISDTTVVERSFFAGSIKLDAPDVLAGTLSYTELDSEDNSKIFPSAYYKLDTVFTINGTEYNKGETESVLVQGESRQSVNFSSLSLLCGIMGWNVSEWAWNNGAIYPVM